MAMRLTRPFLTTIAARRRHSRTSSAFGRGMIGKAARRARRSGAHRVEIANALGEQQRLDPVAVGSLLLDEPLVFAVRSLRVFFGFAGNLDHPAGVELAPHQARQRPHELVDVHAIRLDAARPPVDRHARRLDLVDLIPRRLQRSVQPMAVAPGLEAHMNLGRKAASLLLAGCDAAQQRQQAVEVAASTRCRRTAHFWGVPTPTSHFERLSSNATKTEANSIRRRARSAE